MRSRTRTEYSVTPWPIDSRALLSLEKTISNDIENAVDTGSNLEARMYLSMEVKLLLKYRILNYARGKCRTCVKQSVAMGRHRLSLYHEETSLYQNFHHGFSEFDNSSGTCKLLSSATRSTRALSRLFSSSSISADIGISLFCFGST